MKKKMITGWALLALCLLLMLSSALAETREGVIYLEGMEERIEEVLFESPAGYSFWYAKDVLEADFGTADNTEGARVFNPYSDDFMLLSMISEEEAAAYAGDIAARSAASRVQADVYQELENETCHFLALIADQGRYLRASGAYAREAAEGTAKYFQRVLDSVVLAHPDAFLGRYADENYDEVVLEKQGEAYTMAVSLYRLTFLDEGTVSFPGERVLFHTIDASGNPMTAAFYQDGPDQYALKIEESTWAYLEAGTVFDHLKKQPE